MEPFPEYRELCHDLQPTSQPQSSTQSISYFPGRPDVQLSASVVVAGFLQREFWAEDLERRAQHFWILTTFSSSNIYALHEQKVRGRKIVVTEDPKLHLVWIRDQIFIKPLPTYILSHHFWHEFLLSKTSPLGQRREDICRAATGFLRSYRYLIQHESDFRIAKHDDLRLIPKAAEWKDVALLLLEVSKIEDTDVSNRYQYGEIRLSRLNFYAPLLFGRRQYEHVPTQYGEYFARFYGPILFVFAVATTMLNTMQVIVATDASPARNPLYVWRIFSWFSITVLLLTLVTASIFIGLWCYLVIDEWKFALTNRYSKRRKQAALFKTQRTLTGKA